MIGIFLTPHRDALVSINMWHQQDDAISPTAGIIIKLLQDLFPQQVISSNDDNGWPCIFRGTLEKQTLCKKTTTPRGP